MLDNGRRMARNEPADMARHKPRGEIVAAAGTVANDQIDLAAVVKRFHGVLCVPAGRGRGGEQGRARETDYRTISVHRHERPPCQSCVPAMLEARLIRNSGKARNVPRWSWPGLSRPSR